MATTVGINGFGRIGRLVYRALGTREGFEVKAINDLTDASTLATLFEFDSVHGRYPGEVEAGEGAIAIDGHRIAVTSERDPSNLGWGDRGVDLVIEATGVFRTKDGCQKHLDAGAKRVVLTAPAKSPIDRTIVFGVNDRELLPTDRIVSNASCTTNCLAPVARILHDRFGIVSGLMTTTHAYTASQNILDGPHKDLRRARAAAENIVPTTTGAAVAVGQVLPELDGRLDGMAIRVPVPDGSLVDLTCRLENPADEDAINGAVREAAAGDYAGVVQYATDPLVSTDIIGNPHSAIFDADQTRRLGDDLVKVLAWYDNEWGFSNRVCDLLERMGEQLG